MACSPSSIGRGDIAGREDMSEIFRPHELVDDQPAMAVALAGHGRRERAGAHAGAPHHRLRGNDLAGRERDAIGHDGVDLHAAPRLDAERRQRLVHHRLAMRAD